MTTNIELVSNLISGNTTEFFEEHSPIFNTANDKFSDMYTQKMYATGGNFDIKIPGSPQSSRGSSVTATAIQDLTVSYPITENDIYNVTREIGVYELMFKILGGKKAITDNDKRAIVDNYGKPAYQRLEYDVETECARQLKLNTFFSPVDEVSKLGSVNNFSAVSSANTLMTNLKFGSNRYMMMNTTDAQNLADSLQNSFQMPLNKKITETARVGKGRLANMDLYESANIRKHTAGPLSTQTGMQFASISGDGLTVVISGVPTTATQLVNEGDIFSIPSVYLVDNIGHGAIPTKLTFVAGANSNGNNDGTVDVQINYPLMASGEHANISAIPAVNAPVFVFPDYIDNYCYVPSGLSAISVPMLDVFGAINSETKGDNKVPVKTYLQGLVTDLNNVFRISMIVAIKAITPYLVRLPSRA